MCALLDLLVDEKDESRIGQPQFAQPLVSALQIAIVNLLRSWGIHPTSTVGHSSGEIAAAYAAGALAMEQAIALAHYRGRVAQESPDQGMLAVALGAQEVERYLQDGVVIACRNSPSSVTLSGNRESLMKIVDSLREEAREVLCKILPIHVAYHSRKYFIIP